MSRVIERLIKLTGEGDCGSTLEVTESQQKKKLLFPPSYVEFLMISTVIA